MDSASHYNHTIYVYIKYHIFVASSIERCVELQREIPTKENLPPPSIIQQIIQFLVTNISRLFRSAEFSDN